MRENNGEGKKEKGKGRKKRTKKIRKLVRGKGEGEGGREEGRGGGRGGEREREGDIMREREEKDGIREAYHRLVLTARFGQAAVRAARQEFYLVSDTLSSKVLSER